MPMYLCYTKLSTTSTWTANSCCFVLITFNHSEVVVVRMIISGRKLYALRDTLHTKANLDEAG